jgi:diguanylate cyclase (GGDEF)-like protein
MLSQTISSFLEGHKNQQVCGAVMMLDLDHFKDINDSWGHTVGDQVIKKIGRAVTSLVIGENMLARMSLTVSPKLLGMHRMLLRK